MNNFLKTLIFIILLIGVTACGGNKIDKLYKQKEALEKEYMEACSEKDFDRARTAVEKMKPIYVEAVAIANAQLAKLRAEVSAKEGSDNDGKLKGNLSAKESELVTKFPDYNTHMRYVNDKEIYHLLSKPSRDNNNRIIFLYNSYEFSELPDMMDVVEVAISTGNEELSEKLIKAGVYITPKIAIAAVNADMPQLFDIIISKNRVFVLEDEIGQYYKKEHGTESYKKLLSDIFYKTDKRTQQKIINIGKTEKIDEVSSWIKHNQAELTKEWETKLNDILSASLPSQPAIGIVKSDHYGDIPDTYTSYNSSIESYNKKLKEYIAKVVDLGEMRLANKAVNQIKPTLEWNNLGDWCKVVEHTNYSSVYSAYKVSLNNSEISSARKLIQNGHN